MCTFSTSESECQKMGKNRQFLTLLTWKCASRHKGVHFLNLSTSKSALNLVCFVHFDLDMCFAPQRRPLFQPLNFQKWSGAGVLCTFWLGNVLRATTACTFSASQLPKVRCTWCSLCILTWKCASRHNGVQFFISHLASWLRTRRFSDPVFDPPEPQITGKTRLSYLFVHLHLLSSHSFSSLISLLIFFSSLTLPTSAFPPVHIVGSLTSKLPSNIFLHMFKYFTSFLHLFKSF